MTETGLLPGMTETSTTRVELLGWGEDLLARAAEWLLNEFGDELGDVLVAVPGARAGRIIHESLARQTAPAQRLPRILTTGALTDEVLELEGTNADRLTRTLVWERALRTLDKEALGRIISKRPVVFGAWFRLAELLRSLHGELATEGLSFRDAGEVEFGEDNAGERARWGALALAQDAYREELAKLDLCDPHEARWDALRAGRLVNSCRVVLVGVADPNRIVRAVVEALGEGVTALVFAPDDLRSGFDAVGAIETQVWSEREVPLDLDAWHVVEKPSDQAEHVVDWIARLDASLPAEQITVGVCDEEVTPFLERRLDAKGVWARHGAGVLAGKTSSVKLLDVMARYLARPKYRALATVLRHPELEERVARGCDLGAHDVAKCLDAYHVMHLPDAGDGGWIEGKEGSFERAVADVHAELIALLGDLALSERRSLHDWIGPVRAFLEGVYSGVKFDPEDESERREYEGLRAVAAAIAEVEVLPAGLLSNKVQGHEVLELIHRGSADELIPPPSPKPGTPAIELLGWLELGLDDAAATIVTGFNEGSVPETVQGHPFLPETLRKALRLPTNDDRLARDAYTTTLLTQREHVGFISGRRSVEGDPRLPSRLAFQSPQSECVARTRRMLSGVESARAEAPKDPIPPPSLPESSRARIVDHMRVTDFKAFIESPYLFYLRRVLGYETTSDTACEMNPLWFGIVAHDPLELFGKSDLKDSTDPAAIEGFLFDALKARIHEQFGKTPLPAVLVQAEQIKARYQQFAVFQAQRASEGWSIYAVEWEPKAKQVPLDVDGEVMPITGRVDRIDTHPDGKWAILDYKSGDKVIKPPHDPKGPEDWRDLQLPLYSLLTRELTQELGLETMPQFGYVTLARDQKQIKAHFANKWTEQHLMDAIEAAREVVRKVWKGDFFSEGRRPRVYDAITKAILGEGLLAAAGEDEDPEGEE